MMITSLATTKSYNRKPSINLNRGNSKLFFSAKHYHNMIMLIMLIILLFIYHVRWNEATCTCTCNCLVSLCLVFTHVLRVGSFSDSLLQMWTVLQDTHQIEY